MAAYVIRRAAGALPLLAAISIVLFLLLQMTPGGPLATGEGRASGGVSSEQVERLRGRFGLDDPLPVQYVSWLGGVATGDWGVSYNTGRPVLAMIAERLPVTAQLVGLAFLASLLLAVPAGILAAVRPHSAFDYLSSGLSFAGFATPSFWFALMLLYVFTYTLGLLPASGLHDLRVEYSGAAALWDRALHLAMPVAVLALLATANLTRYVRSAMLEVLDQDYIRTARGHGLSERRVIGQHALKNAAIPIVTVAVLTIPELFLGTVIVETVFALPGMGDLFIDAADLRDYPVLLGVLLLSAVLFVLANLAADVLYRALDPRLADG